MNELSPVATNSKDTSEDDIDDVAMEIFGAEGVTSSASRALISTPNGVLQQLSQRTTVNRFVTELDEPSTSVDTNSECQTPKSSRPIKNPFDRKALDGLANDACSPGIFNYNKKKRKRLMDFEWTIEHRSLLCPAQIPDDGSAASSGLNSPGFEKQADAILDHYWKNVHYLPSPDPSSTSNQSRKTENSLARQALVNSASRTTTSEWLSEDEMDATGENDSPLKGNSATCQRYRHSEVKRKNRKFSPL